MRQNTVKTLFRKISYNYPAIRNYMQLYVAIKNYDYWFCKTFDWLIKDFSIFANGIQDVSKAALNNYDIMCNRISLWNRNLNSQKRSSRIHFLI